MSSNNYHSHDGYSKPHPINQKHRGDLHGSMNPVFKMSKIELYKAQHRFNKNNEILNILKSIDNDIHTVQLLKEIDDVIEILMEHNTERQEPIQSRNDEEPEVNRIGLP